MLFLIRGEFGPNLGTGRYDWTGTDGGRMMITTYDEAERALRYAEHDVAADFGEELVEQAYDDLVQSVATMITDLDLMSEFIRCKLGYAPSWAPPVVRQAIYNSLGCEEF